MIRTTVIFLLLHLLSNAFGQASTFEEAVQEGDDALRKGRFGPAIDKYFAAEAFDPSRKDIVRGKVKMVFDRIVALQAEAVALRDKAEYQAQKADSSARVAKEALGLAEVERGNADRESKRNAGVNMALQSVQQRSRPQLRALMALHGARSLEEIGEDIRRPDIVNALLGALNGLEADNPVRVALHSPPAALFNADTNGTVLELGVDGRIYRAMLAEDTLKEHGEREAIVLQAPPVPVHGMDLLAPGAGQDVIMHATPDGGVTIWSIPSDSIIAETRSSGHKSGITCMAAFTSTGPYLTGDQEGQLKLWRLDGNRLECVSSINIGGIARAMAFIPAMNMIAVANKTDTLYLVAVDGRTTAIHQNNTGAQVLAAHPTDPAVFVGTTYGKVLRVELGTVRATTEHILPQAGPPTRVTKFADYDVPIEAIALRADGRRLAFVNAARELSIIDPTDRTILVKDFGEGDIVAYKGVQVELPGLPRQVTFGPQERIYLGYGQTIERMFCSVEAIAARLCYLLGDANWYWADGTDPTMNTWFSALGIDPDQPNPCSKP